LPYPGRLRKRLEGDSEALQRALKYGVAGVMGEAQTKYGRGLFAARKGPEHLAEVGGDLGIGLSAMGV
jgi:hypothetical protein